MARSIQAEIILSSPGHLVLEIFNILVLSIDIPSLRLLKSIRIRYRDDNRFICESDGFAWHGRREICDY